jgi:hypothetical protein
MSSEDGLWIEPKWMARVTSTSLLRHLGACDWNFQIFFVPWNSYDKTNFVREDDLKLKEIRWWKLIQKWYDTRERLVQISILCALELPRKEAYRHRILAPSLSQFIPSTSRSIVLCETIKRWKEFRLGRWTPYWYHFVEQLKISHRSCRILYFKTQSSATLLRPINCLSIGPRETRVEHNQGRAWLETNRVHLPSDTSADTTWYPYTMKSSEKITPRSCVIGKADWIHQRWVVLNDVYLVAITCWTR